MNDLNFDNVQTTSTNKTHTHALILFISASNIIPLAQSRNEFHGTLLYDSNDDDWLRHLLTNFPPYLTEENKEKTRIETRAKL